ncbi:hypothetical protein ACLKA6_003652 [Drosophila palustris]
MNMRIEEFDDAVFALERTMQRAGQNPKQSQNDQDEVNEDFESLTEILKELKSHDQVIPAMQIRYKQLHQERRDKLRWINENQPSGQRIKLKAVDIPPFYGDITSWSNFADMFDQIINANDEFIRLKICT